MGCYKMAVGFSSNFSFVVVAAAAIFRVQYFLFRRNCSWLCISTANSNILYFLFDRWLVLLCVIGNRFSSAPVFFGICFQYAGIRCALGEINPFLSIRTQLTWTRNFFLALNTSCCVILYTNGLIPPNSLLSSYFARRALNFFGWDHFNEIFPLSTPLGKCSCNREFCRNPRTNCIRYGWFAVQRWRQQGWKYSIQPIN